MGLRYGMDLVLYSPAPMLFMDLHTRQRLWRQYFQPALEGTFLGLARSATGVVLALGLYGLFGARCCC